MKAVVLAGGVGTRLRPLTCTRPKLLFPIGNKPLLDWTLERLAESGVEEVVLAVNYMAETFMRHYGETKYGMKITYSLEDRPLKTGGAIKNAEKLLSQKEPFLVLNGDIFTAIDYRALLKKHEENEATATIALREVEDPTRYGSVELAENNRIKRFVEKPEKGKAPSNIINAGIYVLEPEVFRFIPNNRPVSIEREVFPKLTNRKRLYGYVFADLWVDIGEPLDYLKANKLFLETYLKKSQTGNNLNIEKDAEIIDPTVISDAVNIGEKSKIGPFTSIGEKVSVGKGVHIENSIVLPNTKICDFASIKSAIIGQGVYIGKWVKIEEKCILGDYVTINDKVTLTSGVSVCPSKEISESVLTPKNIM
ncbi:MAG: NDP-sugar synthase [Candidatus Bathyarchaeia archaeon]